MKDKLTIGFEHLGPRPVKNIANAVDVYRVSIGTIGTESATPPPAALQSLPLKPQPSGHRLLMSGAKAGLIIIAVAAINALSWDGEMWFQWPTLGILIFFGLRALQIIRQENAISRH